MFKPVGGLTNVTTLGGRVSSPSNSYQTDSQLNGSSGGLSRMNLSQPSTNGTNYPLSDTLAKTSLETSDRRNLHSGTNIFANNYQHRVANLSSGSTSDVQEAETSSMSHRLMGNSSNASLPNRIDSNQIDPKYFMSNRSPPNGIQPVGNVVDPSLLNNNTQKQRYSSGSTTTSTIHNGPNSGRVSLANNVDKPLAQPVQPTVKSYTVTNAMRITKH